MTYVLMSEWSFHFVSMLLDHSSSINWCRLMHHYTPKLSHSSQSFLILTSTMVVCLSGLSRQSVYLVLEIMPCLNNAEENSWFTAKNILNSFQFVKPLVKCICVYMQNTPIFHPFYKSKKGFTNQKQTLIHSLLFKTYFKQAWSSLGIVIFVWELV